MNTPTRIAIAIGLTLLVGSGSSLTMGDSLRTWYPLLEKPAFNPPNSVFGPVWTALYVLMGTAAGIIWSRGLDVPGRRAMRLYVLQLLLNAAWTALFFGLRAPLVALVELAVLIGVVVLCVRAFWALRPTAGWLLVPYLAWLCFAFVLNGAIVALN